jgi:hypothetical protein
MAGILGATQNRSEDWKMFKFELYLLQVLSQQQLGLMALYGFGGGQSEANLGLGGDIIEAAVPSRVEALASYDVVKVQTFSVSPRNQLIGWEKTLTEGIMLGIIWMGACYGIDKGWKAIWLGLLREWTIGRNWPKY